MLIRSVFIQLHSIRVLCLSNTNPTLPDGWLKLRVADCFQIKASAPFYPFYIRRDCLFHIDKNRDPTHFDHNRQPDPNI